MGYAIACGIARKKVYSKNDIIFIEKKINRIRFLKKSKYRVFQEPQHVINQFDKNIKAVIIAVKPNDVRKTLITLKKYISKNVLVLSIAAGTKINKISSLLHKHQPIARVMPNTPCQIGEGMSILTYNKYATKDQKKEANKIFQSIGKTIELNENKFDIVTAISGSGPGYFCYFVESLIESAKNIGLEEKKCVDLVLQTGLGTMLLLTKTNLTPKALREAVTSKKGTTEAALKVFQRCNLKKIIYNALSAAKKRSIILGES